MIVKERYFWDDNNGDNAMTARNDLIALCEANRASEVLHRIQQEMDARLQGTVHPIDNLGTDDPQRLVDYCIVALEHNAMDTAAIFWMHLHAQQAKTAEIRHLPMDEWLEYACSAGHWKAVPALVRAQALPQKGSFHDRCSRIVSCFILACESISAEKTISSMTQKAIQALIKSIPEYYVYQALEHQKMVQPGSATFMEELMNQNVSDYSKFLGACLLGHSETIDSFLTLEGFNPARSQKISILSNEDTVLHIAMVRGDAELLERLLSFPSVSQCLHAVNKEGLTPLWMGIMLNHHHAVEYLLDRKDQNTLMSNKEKKR